MFESRLKSIKCECWNGLADDLLKTATVNKKHEAGVNQLRKMAFANKKGSMDIEDLRCLVTERPQRKVEVRKSGKPSMHAARASPTPKQDPGRSSGRALSSPGVCCGVSEELGSGARGTTLTGSKYPKVKAFGPKYY